MKQKKASISIRNDVIPGLGDGVMGGDTIKQKLLVIENLVDASAQKAPKLEVLNSYVKR